MRLPVEITPGPDLVIQGDADQLEQLLINLIRNAEVFIENLRPGSMDRMALGTDRLLQQNPGLIIGNMTRQ